MKKISYYYHLGIAVTCYSVWWKITNKGKDSKETKFRYFLLKEWYKHSGKAGVTPYKVRTKE